MISITIILLQTDMDGVLLLAATQNSPPASAAWGMVEIGNAVCRSTVAVRRILFSSWAWSPCTLFK